MPPQTFHETFRSGALVESAVASKLVFRPVTIKLQNDKLETWERTYLDIHRRLRGMAHSLKCTKQANEPNCDDDFTSAK